MYEVSFPGLSIHDLSIDRVAFEVFGFSVYWYGLFIALAIVVCLLLSSRQAPRHGLKSDDILDTFILIIPMMIVFARLYYVAGRWDYYSQDLRRVFSLAQGGLAFYGGVFGGAMAILLVARFKKIPLHRLLDFLAVYVPLGQAIGRWGNFFNQEAFGTNTNLPWGMYSNQTEAYLRSIGGHDPSAPVHPTFFYEFIGNLILFGILYRLRRKNQTPFRISLYYFLGYGILRFFVELIRTDPLYIPGTMLRTSLITSGFLVLGSIVLLAVLQKRRQDKELQDALQQSEDDETGTDEGPSVKEPAPSEEEGGFEKVEADAPSRSGSDFVPIEPRPKGKEPASDGDQENGSDA